MDNQMKVNNRSALHGNDLDPFGFLLGPSTAESSMEDHLFGGVYSVLNDQDQDQDQDPDHDDDDDDAELSPFEPTPIGPNGVISVDKISLAAAPWHSDKYFFESLKLLLEENPASVRRPIARQGDSRALPRWPRKDQGAAKRESQTSTSDSSTSRSCDGEASGGESVSSSAFRSTHLEQWNQRYDELVRFQRDFNHCLVPIHWPRHPSLAHWVKRQRHQYTMKMEGKHSTMTDERQALLEDLGFVWDSHAASWEERWNELNGFRDRRGHCNVPKKCPENPQLAIWVKCQRRQFKLLSEGRNSNMTRERFEKLSVLGFVFNPRLKKNDHRTGERRIWQV
jgi:hypothetical protein